MGGRKEAMSKICYAFGPYRPGMWEGGLLQFCIAKLGFVEACLGLEATECFLNATERLLMATECF